MEIETDRNPGIAKASTPRGGPFNNWNLVAEGWYFVAPSKMVPRGTVKGFNVCAQSIVVWRTSSGKLCATEAYCPHMGTHLAIAKVRGENLQCFFHHWEFDSRGACRKIPCQKAVPAAAQLKTFHVVEKYDSIWLNPAELPATQGPADFGFVNENLVCRHGKSYTRTCHHHVTMINGIDPQHLKTVHNLDIEMSVKVNKSEQENQLDITLQGSIGKRSFKERCARKLFGPIYKYSMRYDYGNNGFLTLLKDLKWFGRGSPIPELHMIFAYRVMSPGKTLVQPIYVTKKRTGWSGWIISSVLMWLTQRAFFSLQGEDGKVYENMDFKPKNLLPIDFPVSEYIRYVNKLPLSSWRFNS